ncbi:hypothetical protein MSG28_009027 [Choristoneura fumiferana]|uniref:Uncharacterized protein n=1 Tax=Choristoneura fumiferana TaxID=7141 RepID=A0ACC0J8Y1_CHOFU|nr:hypothetical protein MSG28_009027 [Choristoneura fumiferana]
MSGWEGYGVSVRCGALGCYQGAVAAADGGSLTLSRPFRNGFPYPKPTVTLKASDIESLEIISERDEAAPAHSMLLAGRGARRAGGGPPRRARHRRESLQPPAPAPRPRPSRNHTLILV